MCDVDCRSASVIVSTIVEGAFVDSRESTEKDVVGSYPVEWWAAYIALFGSSLACKKLDWCVEAIIFLSFHLCCE